MAEKRWKLRDEEMFSGIPKNGIRAPHCEGDLADTVYTTIENYIEQYNASVRRWREYRDEYDGRRMPADSWKYVPIKHRSIPKRLSGSIDRSIEDAMDKTEGPFYIGKLPPAKKVKIATDFENNPIYLDHFKDDTSVPYIEKARDDVFLLREYLRGPLQVLGQMFLRLFLMAAAVVQFLLAVNENIHYEGFLEIEGLPLFYPEVGTGLLLGYALVWLAIGALIVWASHALDEYYFEDGDLLLLGHIILTVAHAICASRLFFVAVAVSGLLIVFMIPFLLLYIYFILSLIPEIFKRMNRKKNIPEDYKPVFFEEAAYCYRFCRLHILWYENATGKRAPSRYYRAIRQLDRLDRKYRKLYRKYEKITAKRA